MKSPINRSTSDLTPSGKVLSGAVLVGGGFSTDASSAMLVVGGDVDLSAIAFLC